VPGACGVLEKRAYEVMSTPVVVVPGDYSLSMAAREMYKANVGSVVVIGEDGGVIGILTRRDAIYSLAAGEARRDPPVRLVMSQSVITGRPDETLGEILEKMRSAGVRHVPILDDAGRPVGIVSMHDILMALAGDCLGEGGPGERPR